MSLPKQLLNILEHEMDSTDFHVWLDRVNSQGPNLKCLAAQKLAY